MWKPIPSTDGLYEASDDGNIRSIARNTTSGRVLKQHVSQTNGYAYVCTCVNGIVKNQRVHKLIAEAFLGYPDGLQINHKDGNKANNKVQNLEYCTQSENMKHAFRTGLEKVTWAIKVIDLDTMQIFKSMTDASQSVGGKKGVCVLRVCDGIRSNYRNHRFARYEDYLNGTIPAYKGKWKKKSCESLWQ